MQPFYAGFVRRAGATIFDGLLVSIPGALAHYHGITTGSVWGDIAIESLVWLPYFVFFTASPWQATPGKRAFGIKVTDLQGRRIGLGRSVARYFASFLSALALCIGYLMVLFTRQRQAMHDLMAGTLVVNAELEPGVLPAHHHVMPLSGRAVASVAGLGFLFLAYVTVTGFLLESPSEAERVADGTPVGASSGPGFRVAYALYRFPFFGGDRQLLKEGTRSYGLGDVRMAQAPGFDPMRIEKRVPVVDGFNIVTQFTREPVVNGFALQLEKDAGFSWEWFDREADYVFRKRQGGGRIQVRIDAVDGLEEVVEILFLEDIPLQLDRHFLVPFTRSATEQMVVKKGSVLKLRE